VHVDVGGVRLWFDVDGAGLVPDGPTMQPRPTLLLLHGGPGFDHSTFKPDFDTLTDVAQLVYLDHRGQGRSDRGDPDDWRLDVWADDVVRFCDAVGIDSPFVLGNSFGGMVAMHYAARHPDHPAGVILSSTTAKMRNDRIYDMFERLGGEPARAMAERFWEGDGNDADFEDYLRECMPLYTTHPGTINDRTPRVIFNRELAREWRAREQRTMDLLPELSAIRCPVLVLAGALDPVCPVADAQDIVDALPPDLVRFECLDDCGHGTYRDQPERTFAIIREFLAPDAATP
jgi:proline iminopeptidase